jgi:hypothetical protein
MRPSKMWDDFRQQPSLDRGPHHAPKNINQEGNGAGKVAAMGFACGIRYKDRERGSVRIAPIYVFAENRVFESLFAEMAT